MTNEEAIEVLKCCITDDCENCPMKVENAYICAESSFTPTFVEVPKDVLLQVLALPKAQQWISVKDRLPEDDTKVLVLTPKGRMRVARVTVPHQRINKRYDPLEAWWWVDGFDRSVNATHWMPLPEPPKEGDGE